MDGMDEKIFEFAYRMALADATGQQAYKGQEREARRSFGDAAKPRKR